MKIYRIAMMLVLAGILVAGCSQEPEMTAPANVAGPEKDGTEALGDPSIPIAAGSGIVQGGVGMVDTDSGVLEFTVPAGAAVNQVLLYWEGGTTGAPGDDTIKVDGNDVTGLLIGGPTNFFQNYWFSAFRADITDRGWVTDGLNSFEITDFDFDFSGGTLDENNGVSMLVIYDDGTTAEIQFFDGLDMAFFDFSPTLDATVPKTFTFAAEPMDRTADMVVLAGSVGVGRPNQIKVTTSAGEQVLDNPLGSDDGLLWDSLIVQVLVPAGDTSLTVELISVVSGEPLGASMAWVGTGLSVPVTPDPELYCIGDFVWFDENGNGCQDEGEMGAEGVEVTLWTGCPAEEVMATVMTNADGYYEFCELMPGDYTVQFLAPDGFVFCEQYAEGCGPEYDSNADADGITDCVTIVDADDRTIDAALCMPPQDGCTLTIGFWKKHAGFGPQDDVLSQYLPVDLGDAGGSKTLSVTDRYIAVDVLEMKTYGRNNNGITKLYAQLLAAKLNFNAGADGSDVADYVADADAFLADHDYMDWSDLSDDDRDMVMMWQGAFDDYNNGDIGPGHCEDDDDHHKDNSDRVMFK